VHNKRLPEDDVQIPKHVAVLQETHEGKAVQLQAWSGPEGSSKLRFPYYMTTAQEVGRLSALLTGHLYPKKCSWYSFLSEAESAPGSQCGRKDYVNRRADRVLKLPVANRTCRVNFNMTAHLLVNPCATDRAPSIYTECQCIHFLFGVITAAQRRWGCWKSVGGGGIGGGGWGGEEPSKSGKDEIQI